MQWKHSDSPPTIKFKVQKSEGKIMATIFWDFDGIITIKYLPPKSTINGAYYAETLKELRVAINEKRKHKLAPKSYLFHDNSPVHSSQIAKDAIKSNSVIEILHPHYSTDLTPSDYYLFKNFKKT